MSYYEDAGLVAVGLTAAVAGIAITNPSNAIGLAAAVVGLFFAALGLFSGVETAVRRGSGGPGSGTAASAGDAGAGASGE